MPLTIALAGNPNAGKSTLFNALTGAHQHVGNWPGKTVEKKEGKLRIAGQEIIVVDLPGTYSLNAFSAEEVITRDFIIEQEPDAVIAVVDAANLERNLYLVIQLLEMGAPLILALNMSDIAEGRGIQIDRKKLSGLLDDIPVIRVIGTNQIGLDDLRQAILQIAGRQKRRTGYKQVAFDAPVEEAINALCPHIWADPVLSQAYPPRWLAIKLLEGDADLLERVRDNAALTTEIEEVTRRINKLTGEDPDLLIADSRYRFVAETCQGVLTRTNGDVTTRSDKIDRVLAHPVWGVPIFLFLMWLVFQITANVTAPYLDWVDGVINGPVARWMSALLELLGLADTWVEGLLVDGIITGVGGVLVFVPVLIGLYIAISILEDTGYMARAAFVMDRFMNKIGLHGKSFVPMVIGFGCTVPAIYATRMLENEIDRKITGFLATFMSCGARLPVYVLFGTAFFGAASGNLVFAMYILGILIAVLTSLLLTRVAFKDKVVPQFVMELPPYRMPNFKTVALQTRERVMSFITHAGTLILLASVIIWFLMAVPVRPGERFNHVEPEASLFGTISRAIAPVFAPAGFGNWEAASSLVTGFLAKEVIITTMSQIYIGPPPPEEAMETTHIGADLREIAVGFGEATLLTIQELINIGPRTVNLIPGVTLPEVNFLGDAGDGESTTALERALRGSFTPLSAVAFNIFILLYVPCMSAVGAMRQEFGTRWMLTQVAYTLILAWLAAVLVFQVGSLLGFG